MKGDIKDKLKSELAQTIFSERQVVYILVQIRKLMELCEDAEHLDALNFFCDWAVHPRLERKRARSIVRQFDRFQNYMNGAKGEITFLNEFTATLRLATFRKELKGYLESHDLPSDIPANDPSWFTFLRYYTRVIEDCPLCISEPKKKLQYVDEVVLTVEHTPQNPRAGSEHRTIVFRWTWVNEVTEQTQFTETEF